MDRRFFRQRRHLYALDAGIMESEPIWKGTKDFASGKTASAKSVFW